MVSSARPLPKFRRQALWCLAIAFALMAQAGVAAAAGTFDGERAMALLRAQCDFGPRIPGTAAHARCADWITSEISKVGLHPERQEFPVTLPLTGDRVDAVNLWATPGADGPKAPALLISAHWDTRPYADQDPAGGRARMLGANDGASGVAMALELARVFQGTPLQDHVALAFWDAEDSGINADLNSWGLGAAYAAKHQPAWARRIALGINLDMVGGQGLQIRPETHSMEAAADAMRTIWRLGGALAPGRFIGGEPYELIDDHLPWNRAGVPFIDLAGFPWQYWHTTGDTPEHCDPQILAQVGRVVQQYALGGEWKTQGRKVAAEAGATTPMPATAP